MPDASTRIEGRIASDVRYNEVGGNQVANVRILAGRSKKDDQGNWQTLSTTAYDVAYWREAATFVQMLNPQKGDSVVATGSIGGLESFDGQNGPSLSAKVAGEGLRVFPKRDQHSGGGFQSSQPRQSAPAQNNGQWGAGTGGGDSWGNVAQPGSGQQGFPADPPF